MDENNKAYTQVPRHHNENFDSSTSRVSYKHSFEMPREEFILDESFETTPPDELIPQSLRNHALPPAFSSGNAGDILGKLRAQPIAGYTPPKKINPGNNRRGMYSTYVDKPAESNTNPYRTAGDVLTPNSVFNKAYAIKHCLQCNYTLDKCICAMAQNSRK